MKGYKVFNHDWTCRGFQYEVGKTFEIDGEIGICNRGFHFCKSANKCFNYYSFDSRNKVAEVEAIGFIITDADKSVTNKIRIVREISWAELLEIVNIGVNCTGFENTGDKNSGDYNTGDRNSGDWNTGTRNYGEYNTGDCNVGDRNSGDENTGDWNVGDRNYGNWNVGNLNVGYWNTGDCNIVDFSNGVFCTEEDTIKIFDEESNMTLRAWRESRARRIINRIELSTWVYTEDMTKEEKEKHSSYKIAGGYLKSFSYKEAWANLWNNLDDNEKRIIMNIPNFNKEKFRKITGIDVEKIKYRR